ncbi:MAG TPA: AI-2E family transporter [Allosphingosinicella sp.]|jgi:predicted PurR-regulated permease PerM|nr:AI-2E family transporter [Allosphingosinicella sp.]
MTEATPPELKGQPPEEAQAHLNQMRLLVALMTLVGLWIARDFLLELAWAVTLAVALWPLYMRATGGRKARGTRNLIPLGFTLATGLVLMLPLAVVAVEAARDSQAALQWVAQAQKSGVPQPSWLGHLPFGGRLSGWWQGHLAAPQGASRLLGSINASSVASWTGTIATQVASRFWFFAVTLLALFLILRDGQRLAANAVGTARRFYGEFGERFVDRVGEAVRAAVNGTVLVAIGEGSLIGIGYAVTNVPRPVLFTLATIGFALLPFGAWAAFGAGGLVLLAQGHVAAAIGLFVFGAAVMLIGDNVVQPAVVGNSIELPFLWIFVATFGGLETFGLVGLFVGPALMAALFLVWKEWLGLDPPEKRRRRWRARRGAAATTDS